MYQYLKINEAVANYSGAMEADTISNGRNPKSQTSRGNPLIKVKFPVRLFAATLIAFFIFLLPGCDAIAKKSLSGVYEPESSEGYFTRIEFDRDGTCILTARVFGIKNEQSMQYTITGNKILIGGGEQNSMPCFEIKDSNTLLTLPIPIMFERGEIWKKKK